MAISHEMYIHIFNSKRYFSPFHFASELPTTTTATTPPLLQVARWGGESVLHVKRLSFNKTHPPSPAAAGCRCTNLARGQWLLQANYALLLFIIPGVRPSNNTVIELYLNPGNSTLQSLILTWILWLLFSYTFNGGQWRTFLYSSTVWNSSV